MALFEYPISPFFVKVRQCFPKSTIFMPLGMHKIAKIPDETIEDKYLHLHIEDQPHKY